LAKTQNNQRCQGEFLGLIIFARFAYLPACKDVFFQAKDACLKKLRLGAQASCLQRRNAA